jgi:RimJ/RimL family protein N-acetyltransferase
MYSDTNIMKHLPFMTRSNKGGWTVEDAATRRQFMETLHTSEAGLNSVVKMNDGRFAGVAGFRDLHWWNRSAEMGIILHSDFWSKGLATEIHLIFLGWAFEVVKLNRVEFKTSVSNSGMNYLCKEVMHATLEGTMRDYFPANDCSDLRAVSEDTQKALTYESVALYSLLAPEWPRAKESLQARMKALAQKPV